MITVVGLVEAKKISAGNWLKEPVIEHSLISERYDLSISLLVLEGSGPSADIDEEDVEDAVDYLTQPSIAR